MDLFAHYAVGMFLYKIFGSYWAIVFAVILDIDHVLGYIYENAIKKKEMKEVPRIAYFVYSKRTWLHSFLGLALLLILFGYKFSPLMIIVCVGSHLLLDSLDKIGIEILPFISKKRLKGPFPVAYKWDHPGEGSRKHQSSISIATTAIFLALFFFL